jgi:ubiquinone/menaquinone biosynthesis C-methylase UbiE
MMNVDNRKEVFEKEGQLFNHIEAMYINSKGYEHYGQKRRKNIVVRQLKSLRVNAVTALDIGGAEGLFVKEAENLGYFAVGCDISRLKIVKAKELKVIECDAQNLPFKDKSFDVVLLNRILECIPNDEKALSEAFRVARKYLIITVPNEPPNAKLKRRLIGGGANDDL